MRRILWMLENLKNRKGLHANTGTRTLHIYLGDKESDVIY
jgi:hypothetical protein